MTTRNSAQHGELSPVPTSVAIVTVSDRGAAGLREDRSGQVLAECLESQGYTIQVRTLVPDAVPATAEELRRCADVEQVALVITTGGTGVAPRDLTPEATLQVVERLVPGMAEAMRAASLLKTPHAMISRAVVGIRNATLIINLPGSPRGALENLSVLLPALPHALAKIQGDPSECGQ